MRVVDIVRLSVLPALAAAGPLAAAAPIQCAAARYDVEQTICSRPVLLGHDKAIAERLDALKQACPSQRALLAEGQRFWLRERWDCRNAPGAFDTPDALAACLASRMAQRLNDLDKVDRRCDLTPLAASYRFVDVGYLRRFSSHYLGKTVSVFGTMQLGSCTEPASAPTAASVVAKGERFPVVFSAMPERERAFLCARYPAAHWRGTVRQGDKGLYLFLTDLLGQPLPE